MVERVVSGLDALLARHVREAEVYVVDLPGAELVVDGVDPRALVVLDTPPDPVVDGGDGPPKRGPTARLFVYQRNVERAAGTLGRLEEELQLSIEREVTHVFLGQTRPDKSQLN